MEELILKYFKQIESIVCISDDFWQTSAFIPYSIKVDRNTAQAIRFLPNILVWKLDGNAQIPKCFTWFAGNLSETVHLHIMKFGEILTFTLTLGLHLRSEYI